MRIDVSKFGKTLISRPAGRDAFLSARAYNVPKDSTDVIELDFGQVQVLTPSWADYSPLGWIKSLSVSLYEREMPTFPPLNFYLIPWGARAMILPVLNPMGPFSFKTRPKHLFGPQ